MSSNTVNKNNCLFIAVNQKHHIFKMPIYRHNRLNLKSKYKMPIYSRLKAIPVYRLMINIKLLTTNDKL